MTSVQFTANESKRKEIIRQLREQSRKQKLLNLLAAVSVIWLLLSIVIVNGTLGDLGNGSIRIAVVSALAFLIGGIPMVVMLSLCVRGVSGAIANRRWESLTLSHQGVEHTYKSKVYKQGVNYVSTSYHYTSILYRDITRIELYEDVQAIKVFGKVHICSQPGTPTEQNTLRIIDDPDKAYRVFFLYYHDADKLVQLLSERSGQPVIRLPQCTGTLQEKN